MIILMNKLDYDKITRDLKCITQKVANDVYVKRASIIIEELGKHGIQVNIDLKTIKKGRPKNLKI